MIKQEYNPSLQYRGFLLTMVDIRSDICLCIVDKIQHALNGLVFETIIPRNRKLAESAFYGKPVILIDKNCKGAHSYVELASELLNQNGTGESSLAKGDLTIARNYQ